MGSFRDDPVDSEAILADIRALVEIESPSHHVTGVNAVLETVARMFEGTGASLQRIPTDAKHGDILVVRCNPERNDPGILVLSHMDTVHPVGVLGSTLPWRRVDDRIHGPGVYDMKGGLVLAVAAWKRIAAAGRRTPLPVTFMFTPDEEISSPVSRPFIEREAVGNRFALITEPARDGGKVTTARKGIGRFVITCKGRPAHAGSQHSKGRNAIRAMAEIALKIADFTDYSRGVTTNLGTIHGGTGANVVAETCTMLCDLRVCDRAAAAEMDARFRALTCSDPDVVVTISGGMTRPPFPRDAGVAFLFEKASGIAADLGHELESAELVGGGSDGNFTAERGVPTLDGLGVDGDGAHTHDEYMLFSSIERGTRQMQGLMETLE